MPKNGKTVNPRDKKLPFEKLKKIINAPDVKMHFVGIGGVSMYWLAVFAHEKGAKVSGSDRYISERAHRLANRGIQVIAGHSAENVDGAQLVVYSHAITEDNSEIVHAREIGIPVVSRAEYMGVIMQDYKNRIGVSGTHGKSTTTAMLDVIFTRAMTEPTVCAGAVLQTGGEPFKIGSDGVFLYEACEYKDSFLHFAPTIALALNMELDHTDYFKDTDELSESFRRALCHATECAIINYDDEYLCDIIPRVKTRVVTFGQSERADYRYLITAFNEWGYSFEISRRGNKIADFRLNIPGVYNVTNAVGAIVCALEYGVDVDTVREAISSYVGIPGRMEYLGERHGRAVYADYAHHPTAVRAAINNFKMMTHGQVTVVFKPHTYSRTKSFWEQFRHALSLADHIVILDIYPAREDPIPGISSARMAWEIGDHAVYCKDSDAANVIDSHTHGAILLMGAGDMETIREALVDETV